jgi:hypothetical protein
MQLSRLRREGGRAGWSWGGSRRSRLNPLTSLTLAWNKSLSTVVASHRAGAAWLGVWTYARQPD